MTRVGTLRATLARMGGPERPDETVEPIAHLLSTNSVRQRVVDKSVALANRLLRDHGIPEIGHCYAAHAPAHLHQPDAGGGL